MIRHIALFRCKDGTTDAAIGEARRALEALPDQIDELVRLETHVDLGLIEGTYDFGLLAEFSDETGYQAYAAHPAHVEVSDTYVQPILDEIARLQHRLD